MSKFLTYEERLAIARGLKESLSFGAIAKENPFAEAIVRIPLSSAEMVRLYYSNFKIGGFSVV